MLRHFYPRPPGGGRPRPDNTQIDEKGFLSTPSGWRATADRLTISAARYEFLSTPSGWRATAITSTIGFAARFLSTPSGWRATGHLMSSIRGDRFLSTPSGWRATDAIESSVAVIEISIHALRVEGDRKALDVIERSRYFYPRPPGGGRRLNSFRSSRAGLISIHALRVEGDSLCADHRAAIPAISIHALRVEGDYRVVRRARRHQNFYPRPPGGGRPAMLFTSFLSQDLFLSTPSGWRATAKTDKVFVCFCAKGRRICLFKTRKEKICRWRFKKDKFWVLIWCEGSGKSVCALASHCG